MAQHNLGQKIAALGFIGFAIFIAFGVAQIYAGYIGIAHHLGSLWAALAIGAAVIFRFTLPITIGSFFGAMNVWGWHWIGAALFAAPGLLLCYPWRTGVNTFNGQEVAAPRHPSHCVRSPTFRSPAPVLLQLICRDGNNQQG